MTVISSSLFSQKALSQMFDRVLKTPLKLPINIYVDKSHYGEVNLRNILYLIEIKQENVIPNFLQFSRDFL